MRFSFLGEGAGARGMLHPSGGSGGSGIGASGSGLLHPSPGSGGSGIGVPGGSLLHPSPGSGGSGVGVPGGGLLHPSQGSGASGGAGSAGEGEDATSPAHAGNAAHALQGMQQVRCSVKPEGNLGRLSMHIAGKAESCSIRHMRAMPHSCCRARSPSNKAYIWS